MTGKYRVLWLAAAILLMTAAGCREGGQTPSSGPAGPTSIAGDLASSSGLENGQNGSIPETVDVPDVFDSLGALSSYQMTVSIQFDRPDQSSGPDHWRIENQLSISNDPPARQAAITTEGMALSADLQAMTVVQTGRETYLQLPGLGCITSAATESSLIPEAADPNSVVGGLHQATLTPGAEIVNGVSSSHYIFDESSLPRFAGTAVEVDGALYMATDGRYPTRLELRAQGEANYLGAQAPQTGTLTMRLDVTNVNQPIQIQPPSACTQASIYPVTEDAFDVTTIEDLVSYKSASSVDEVVTFYESQMPLAGWSPVEEPVLLDDAAFLTYDRGGIVVTISVEANGEGQPTSVLISP